ncbi:DUF411 domain-containing protein [Rhizobium leguminosarum]|uniref:DUF411 domain-containing protein n=1 Tax=Rhizobium leguminosarum TaxID=384 RepID=UPI0014419FE9|nr:DUF411 domain-containing protein [Rhizobium leguminosarum]MBY3177616.1 DUF411 domain-containing protein [Rhizobium leguminosarum]NKN01150.1 DUF411 domain-containing protein [Rhizobium leguminosarum bv. viciae]
MKRRQFLCSVATLGSISLIGVARAAGESMIVYKDPNCGCCEAWANAMSDAGFTVTVKHDDDLAAIKAKYKIPAEMQGCHTAVSGPYVFEGHVPLEGVETVMSKRPDIAGLAVPGMPAGSLGMGNDPQASYDVYSLSKDGKAEVFSSVRPS